MTTLEGAPSAGIKLETPTDETSLGEFTSAKVAAEAGGYTNVRTVVYEGSATDTPNYPKSGNEEVLYDYLGEAAGENVRHVALVGTKPTVEKDFRAE